MFSHFKKRKCRLDSFHSSFSQEIEMVIVQLVLKGFVCFVYYDFPIIFSHKCFCQTYPLRLLFVSCMYNPSPIIDVTISPYVLCA